MRLFCYQFVTRIALSNKKIFDWFKEQFYKLYNNLKQSTHPTIKKGKGMKL